MIIDDSTLLFFDASCLIAAAGSPKGGSGFLLSLCARNLLRGAVSQAVLLEAERNIRAKLSLHALNAYHELLQVVPFTLASVPHVSTQAAWLQTINAKDVHVVASALVVDAPYLIPLDRALAKEIGRAELPLQALSPGGFIRTVLLHHVKYPSLRS